jgi:hypothetical protein
MQLLIEIAVDNFHVRPNGYSMFIGLLSPDNIEKKKREEKAM